MFKRFTTHTLMALAEASLVALLVVGLMAGAAFAGKGGGKPGGGGTSVSWRMVTDADGNNAPNWGEIITFDFSTSADRPIISLTCSQGGDVVYGDSRPMYWPNLWTTRGTSPCRRCRGPVEMPPVRRALRPDPEQDLDTRQQDVRSRRLT